VIGPSVNPVQSQPSPKQPTVELFQRPADASDHSGLAIIGLRSLVPVGSKVDMGWGVGASERFKGEFLLGLSWASSSDLRLSLTTQLTLFAGGRNWSEEFASSRVEIGRLVGSWGASERFKGKIKQGMKRFVPATCGCVRLPS
jgi:hypothetical protein